VNHLTWTEVEEARTSVLARRGWPVARCMPPLTSSIRRCRDGKGLPLVARRGARPGFSTMEKKLSSDRASCGCAGPLDGPEVFERVKWRRRRQAIERLRRTCCVSR